MAEAIQAEHLAYAYPGAEGGPGISVFRDLNLKIEEGTFVAVLGRNGCGKSTLAKHCNAIALPEGGTGTVPSSGSAMALRSLRGGPLRSSEWIPRTRAT